MTDSPTVVLLHGAFADSSGWAATIAGLESQGLTCLAAPNQLRELEADAANLRSILATIDGPVVLVGHSYGGAVIGEAARGADNVAALVFLAAYVLEEGESIALVLDPDLFPGSLLGPDTTLVRPFADPSAPDGTNGDMYIRNEDFHAVFIGDADPQLAHLMAVQQRPLALSAYTGVAGKPAWHSIPSWALVTELDRAIPAAGQEWMARRAGAQVRSVGSSHAVMVTHAAEVIDIVAGAVASVPNVPIAG